MEILCRVAVDALIGMGAEEVALRLHDVGRTIGATVAIVEGEGRGEGGAATPLPTASITAWRQPASAALISATKNGSCSRLGGGGVREKLVLISPRKRLRIMQPARQSKAISP